MSADPYPRLPLPQWSVLHTRLHWVYDTVLKNSRREPQRFLASPQAAWRLFSGSVTLVEAGQTTHYGPGEWVFPGERVETQELSDELGILSIRFEAAWVHGVPLFSRQETVVLREQARLDTLARELAGAVAALPGKRRSHLDASPNLSEFFHLQPLWSGWMAGWYDALIAHGVALTPLETMDERVRHALGLIESRPLHDALPERELARAVGWSTSQFNRVFQRQTGSTPAALWNRRKLEAAQLELRHGSRSIKAIAYHLGFSAPEHFTRWFGRHAGCSPTLFRQQARSEAGAL